MLQLITEKFKFHDPNFSSERTRVLNERIVKCHDFAVDTMVIRNKYGRIIKTIRLGYDK